MGLLEGFDMVPRLSQQPAEQQKWKLFIEEVKNFYKDDNIMQVHPTFLQFNVLLLPRLPLEGHKFICFTSRIGKPNDKVTGECIKTIASLAKSHFGDQVQRWNELFDTRSFYSLQDITDSKASYEQSNETQETPNITVLHVTEKDTTDATNTALYEIQTVPGKGKGLVARCNISKGTRILCEKPIFTIPVMSPTTPMKHLENAIATRMRTFSKTQQREYLSLHNCFRGIFPLSNILKTNSFPCVPDYKTCGAYATLSRINHSCLPNAHTGWNPEAKHGTVHAIRDISAGEEITMDYQSGGLSSARQARFKDFAFECTCPICSRPLPELRASDARLAEMQRLQSTIKNKTDRSLVVSKASLTCCRSLVKLLEEEYAGTSPGSPIVLAYHDAHQIGLAYGDQARASVFAQRALEVAVLCQGRDHPTTKELADMVERPAEQPLYGTSFLWKTEKEDVPRGLTEEKFEKWLWRVGI